MARVMKIIPLELYEQLVGEGRIQDDVIRTGPNNNYKGEDVINQIPLKQRGRVESILKIISRSLDWKPNGILVHLGQEIPGSNITDLLTLATRAFLTKRWNLPGLEIFASVLRSENVPSVLLSSQMLEIMSNETTHKEDKTSKWIKYEDL